MKLSCNFHILLACLLQSVCLKASNLGVSPPSCEMMRCLLTRSARHAPRSRCTAHWVDMFPTHETRFQTRSEGNETREIVKGLNFPQIVAIPSVAFCATLFYLSGVLRSAFDVVLVLGRGCFLTLNSMCCTLYCPSVLVVCPFKLKGSERRTL